MKRKLLIIGLTCFTCLFILRFQQWYWWNLNLAIKIGTIMEQHEPNVIEKD